MASDKMICLCNGVTYASVRKAMADGARSVEDIQEATGAGTVCGGCIEEIEKVLDNACTCKNVSTEEVIAAVKNGADTFEKVGVATTAGTACGKCKCLIESIIELKK
ncbi:MAG: (2Fe-2S)-binding protein [Clostridium sp.]|uniref:(2Fe-2S)-binding protein n=1 Tax=Clostridium sp. TaxID=1506 RepID=UPI00306992E6